MFIFPPGPSCLPAHRHVELMLIWLLHCSVRTKAGLVNLPSKGWEKRSYLLHGPVACTSSEFLLTSVSSQGNRGMMAAFFPDGCVLYYVTQPTNIFAVLWDFWNSWSYSCLKCDLTFKADGCCILAAQCISEFLHLLFKKIYF